jgi:hypothetical protein
LRIYIGIDPDKLPTNIATQAALFLARVGQFFLNMPHVTMPAVGVVTKFKPHEGSKICLWRNPMGLASHTINGSSNQTGLEYRCAV